MSALGLVENTAPSQDALKAASFEIILRLEDSLASARRIWMRGCLEAVKANPDGASSATRWWNRLTLRRAPISEPQKSLHIETRVSGQLFKAEVLLQDDCRFEAMVDGHLPAARRGWRTARNHVAFGNQTIEQCNLVLTPPPGALAANLVVLPSQYTRHPGKVQDLQQAEFASQLPEMLRHPGISGNYLPVYYIGCISPDAGSLHAQLALAATGLGWPPGNFVLLPTPGEDISAAVTKGIDRLRWLFANSLELTVINLEPAVSASLASSLAPVADRAPVQRFINYHEEGGKIRADLTVGEKRIRVLTRPTRAALVPRHPVVFCHGMLAFSMLRMKIPDDVNCFSPLKDFLRQRGFSVLFPQVPPTSGVVERAACLRDQISHWTNEPVNLIAHSMGGLDARYMITHLGMGHRVSSLTTVSTPHRGTYLADWFMANFRNRVPLLLAFEALGTNIDGFRDCQLAPCVAFNANTPNLPHVRYFSYGGEISGSRLSPALRRAWNILIPVEGANDGMVSVQSAHWGEYLGTVHADHFAQTPDAVFLRPGENFDALGFYTRLLEDLARRGF